jgi:alkylation response protein AidB-like acyl-CoA dehydrogenase
MNRNVTQRAYGRSLSARRRTARRRQAYIGARRGWERQLAEAGLAGVTWPKEFGGRGLGPIEQVTVNQELSSAGVPGILDVIGIGMLGPCRLC